MPISLVNKYQAKQRHIPQYGQLTAFPCCSILFAARIMAIIRKLTIQNITRF